MHSWGQREKLVYLCGGWVVKFQPVINVDLDRGHRARRIRVGKNLHRRAQSCILCGQADSDGLRGRGRGTSLARRSRKDGDVAVRTETGSAGVESFYHDKVVSVRQVEKSIYR